MIILYLHGLNSTNLNERTEWLSQYGKIINPLMDYKNVPKAYHYLEKLVKKYKPDLIVGSSMGGFMGYHLGNYYGIPTILLNPALIMKTLIKPTTAIYPIKNIHYIAIGSKDEVIPPFTTKKILQEDRVKYKLKEYNRGHETPIKDFIAFSRWTGLF
jgi:esterase/lipase